MYFQEKHKENKNTTRVIIVKKFSQNKLPPKAWAQPNADKNDGHKQWQQNYLQNNFGQSSKML